MLEDTYTRSGRVVILKNGGVVQWQKVAIATETDGELEHSRTLRQTYTRMRCVMLPKYGGVVQWQKVHILDVGVL